MSPMLGPPKTRNISLLEPPSSLMGRMNFVKGPKEEQMAFPPVPPDTQQIETEERSRFVHWERGSLEEKAEALLLLVCMSVSEEGESWPNVVGLRSTVGEGVSAGFERGTRVWTGGMLDVGGSNWVEEDRLSVSVGGVKEADMRDEWIVVEGSRTSPDARSLTIEVDLKD
jgi:hypothetical protein